MLTDGQKRIVELSKKMEGLKKELSTLGLELDSLLLDYGVGSSFQDPTDNTVYEIVQPKGTFIEYRKIGYERTKREGEFRGTMSKKRAEELGYKL